MSPEVTQQEHLCVVCNQLDNNRPVSVQAVLPPTTQSQQQRESSGAKHIQEDALWAEKTKFQQALDEQKAPNRLLTEQQKVKAKCDLQCYGVEACKPLDVREAELAAEAKVALDWKQACLSDEVDSSALADAQEQKLWEEVGHLEGEEKLL